MICWSSAAPPTAAAATAAAAAAAAENHGLIVYAEMYTFYPIGKLLFNLYWPNNTSTLTQNTSFIKKEFSRKNNK